MDAFCTLLTWGIKAITGLIPIYLHLQKISSQHQLRTALLLSNHAINLLFKKRYSKNLLSPHLF